MGVTFSNIQEPREEKRLSKEIILYLPASEQAVKLSWDPDPNNFYCILPVLWDAGGTHPPASPHLSDSDCQPS